MVQKQQELSPEKVTEIEDVQSKTKVPFVFCPG
jgi:hypothetical protein